MPSCFIGNGGCRTDTLYHLSVAADLHLVNSPPMCSALWLVTTYVAINTTTFYQGLLARELLATCKTGLFSYVLSV